MIKCKNLNKNFDDGENKNHILKDISLEVMSGDTLAINGSSGSGKSTLLHILSGLENTSSGEIFIDDTNISYLSENELCKLRLEKIGFIYQFHHLIKELDVYENISLPLLVKKTEKGEIEKKVNEIIEKVSLNDRKNFQIDKLSGGERQRVAIARAIINNPKIIFADEPTGNLDSKNAKNVFSLLKDIANSNNSSLIIATHDNGLTKMLDKKIIIENGSIHYV
tara:strand:- start:661 stop:1329 length:669 start_codon:yes stop_codon:yes gene_type:complete